MNSRITHRLTALLLLTAMLAVSCGTDAQTDDTTASNPGETTVAPTEEYVFTDKYKGFEYKFLNIDDIYSMHATIDREGETGDNLNDAMYNRVVKLEEQMGITLTEVTNQNLNDLVKLQQNSILADEDEYSAMYIPANKLTTFTEQNLLSDLKSLDGFNFDKEWWLASFNDANTVGGSLYAAAGYSQLMIVDSLWCVYFNEDMMADLKLDLPYDLVREGKWTFDEFFKLQSAGTNLNGDDSFEWKDDGNSIYGLSGGAAERFMNGAGEFLIKNNDGKLSVTYGTERFYDVVSTLASNIKLGDGRAYNNYKSGLSDDTPGNYINVFETERSLLLAAEICKSVRMRDKDFTFGIVPFPKFDAAQSRYYAAPFDGVPLFAIPYNCSDPERSAVIADALTYLSYTDVWPTYRDVTLSVKGMRNDDSVEMLGLILDSATPDPVFLFGIGRELRTAINTLVQTGEGNAASTVAAQDATIKSAIEKING